VEFEDLQASLRVERPDGTVLTACERCRTVYKGKEQPEEPPCETCRAELLEENEEAAQIFSITRSQLIMGFDRPIDINHTAIHSAMDLYGIKNRKECFEKVLTLSRWWLKKVSSEG
jgi:hypothetical protein